MKRVAALYDVHGNLPARRQGELTVVNAGRVGAPYERRRGAFWALLGPGVDLRRTRYDAEAAVDAIRATGYPEADEFAAWPLEPVSAEKASAYVEGVRGA